MSGAGNLTPELYKSVDRNSLRFCFKQREKRTNKGDYGSALCVCGSASMGGAAILSARAAYRVGAGVVRIFTHSDNYSPILSSLPEAVIVKYSDDGLSGLISSVAWADTVLVGCGLSISEQAKEILQKVLSFVHSPLVIDADALNILAKDPSLWKALTPEQKKRTVITPHMGEMSRLVGEPIEDVLDDPVGYAVGLARQLGVVVVLKDHNTVITDGEVIYKNHSGCPAMATAGSGDVLAGIICGINGQTGLECESFIQRVAMGVYLHGCAGELAAKRLGEYSVMASDICENIPEVLKDL